MRKNLLKHATIASEISTDEEAFMLVNVFTPAVV
jgi:hypothetical protein